MEEKKLLLLLEALEEPAFFAREQIAVCGNAAFHALPITDGTPLSSFLSSAVSEDGSACLVGGERFTLKTAPLDDGTLYILYRVQQTVSVNVLAHTAKRLRATLQQLYNAIDRLDAAVPEETPVIDDMFSALLQSTFSLTRIADQLNTFGQLSGGSYAPAYERVELSGFLRELLEKAEALLEQAGIRLEWQIPEPAFPGCIDRKTVSLALWNLLANAAQNAQGGRVSVCCERLRLTRLRIKVTDSGFGIAPEQQPDLMQRYQVALEDALQQPGIGLGLQIVQYAAQLHGGSMALAMEPGGATSTALLLETNRPGASELCSRPNLYVQSLDEGLVGLADVLPRKAFDRRAVL